MACYVLPKRTMKEIRSIFRRFLWGGANMEKKSNSVAWADVSVPYREGGLAIQDLDVTSSAAIIKHVWNLHTHPTSLRVRWVKANLIKERNFWTMAEPIDSSWCWRYMLRGRTAASKFMLHLIGDGCSTQFWTDNWHPFGRLHTRFPAHTRYDSYLRRNAKVSIFLGPNGWNFPNHIIPIIRDIFDATRDVPVHLSVADKLVWTPSTDGTFSVQSTY